MPSSSLGRANTQAVQFHDHRVLRQSSRLHGFERRAQLLGEGLRRRLAFLDVALQVRRPRRAEPDAPRLRGGQGVLGALGDRVALPLGHDAEHLQHGLVCLRRVRRRELDAAFDQAADEMHVPRQTVELGDDQRRLEPLAGVERLSQLGALVQGVRPLARSTSTNSPASVQAPPFR